MKERISEIINPVVGESLEPPPAIDLTSLHGMTREELIALCTRLLCQCGMVATMTKEQTAQAMLDVLAETALKPIVAGLSMKADIQSRLNAIDKWLDRERGKPMQTQVVALQASVDHRVILPATKRFIDSIMAPVILDVVSE